MTTIGFYIFRKKLHTSTFGSLKIQIIPNNPTSELFENKKLNHVTEFPLPGLPQFRSLYNAPVCQNCIWSNVSHPRTSETGKLQGFVCKFSKHNGAGKHPFPHAGNFCRGILYLGIYNRVPLQALNDSYDNYNDCCCLVHTWSRSVFRQGTGNALPVHFHNHVCSWTRFICGGLFLCSQGVKELIASLRAAILLASLGWVLKKSLRSAP